jgi:quercetin dioxygenase-like cupin family protein
MALHHLNPSEKIHLPSVDASVDMKTSALVKTDRFEAVELVLRAGDEIPSHAVPGYATVHCLQGSMMVEAAGQVQLDAGDWLYLDRGQPHSVTAIQDSALLLTILFD